MKGPTKRGYHKERERAEGETGDGAEPVETTSEEMRPL